MLEVKHLGVTYSREILRDITFSVVPGSIVGIVGANGEGKSSLLRILSGHQDTTTGEVFWNKKKVLGPNYNLLPGHPDIQLVNQDYQLDLFHTVHENVKHGMSYLPNDVQETFSAELMDLVNLTDLAKEEARYLSGGEKQRLAIARALASEPEVLLLDEPFAHLDAHLKLKIGTYLQELAKVRNLIVILVSHEGKEIMEWCREVYFLANKTFQRKGTPEEFYFQPESENEALFFGEINKGKLNGREVLFRPVEYRKHKTLGTKVDLISTQFCGVYYRNVVRVSKNVSWILYSSKPFAEISHVQIQKKNK